MKHCSPPRPGHEHARSPITESLLEVSICCLRSWNPKLKRSHALLAQLDSDIDRSAKANENFHRWRESRNAIEIFLRNRTLSIYARSCALLSHNEKQRPVASAVHSHSWLRLRPSLGRATSANCIIMPDAVPIWGAYTICIATLQEVQVLLPNGVVLHLFAKRRIADGKTEAGICRA
jgi:hypothetical protein